MATNEDKKTSAIEKGRYIEALKELPGWSYLLDRLGQAKADYDLSLSTDWPDFKYRLGVQKGLSLLEEIAEITIIKKNLAKKRKKRF